MKMPVRTRDNLSEAKSDGTIHRSAAYKEGYRRRL